MKSLFLTTDNFKSMLNQYKENHQRMILATYKPKGKEDTYVLVSELGKVKDKEGFWLFWKNKVEMEDPEVEKIRKALEDAGLPF